MYLVLEIWGGTYGLEIPIDASYTYSGMDLRNRSKHLKGSNRDIWKMIYDEIDFSTRTDNGVLDSQN